MSVELLNELKNELIRISVAGSDLAIDDYRIKSLIPQLKKTGETSQVFNKIYQLTEKLQLSERLKSAENLFELSTLLYSVLYTQGRTGKEGEISDFEVIPLSYKTQNSYRSLSKLIEALTTKGSGRYAIIYEAYQNKSYLDFRLIPYILEGLNDSYSETAEVCKKMLENMDSSILPLLGNINIGDGKKIDCNKLDLIYKFEKKNKKELYLKVLEEGSAEIKQTALLILSDFKECEDIVINYTDYKNKEVRNAAFRGLIKYETTKSMDILIECLLNGNSSNDICYTINFDDKKYDYITDKLLEEGFNLIKKIEKNEELTKKEIFTIQNIYFTLKSSKNNRIKKFLEKTEKNKKYFKNKNITIYFR